MIPIYNFFTFWIIFLSLLEKKLDISVYPSLVFCLIGSTILCLCHNSRISAIIFSNILHLIPFLWTKYNLEDETIFNNLYIGAFYLLFISIQKKSIVDIYHEQLTFFNKPNFIKNLFEKGETNMCIFC